MDIVSYIGHHTERPENNKMYLGPNGEHIETTNCQSPLNFSIGDTF
jgi:hypothetical protein